MCVLLDMKRGATIVGKLLGDGVGVEGVDVETERAHERARKAHEVADSGRGDARPRVARNAERGAPRAIKLSQVFRDGLKDLDVLFLCAAKKRGNGEHTRNRKVARGISEVS